MSKINILIDHTSSNCKYFDYSYCLLNNLISLKIPYTARTFSNDGPCECNNNEIVVTPYSSKNLSNEEIAAEMAKANFFICTHYADTLVNKMIIALKNTCTILMLNDIYNILSKSKDFELIKDKLNDTNFKIINLPISDDIFMIDVKQRAKNFILNIKNNVNDMEIMPKEPNYYLSVLAIVKNEALYFKEWLDYYIKMGVEHFFIYDNESTDNTFNILKPYIEQGYISYTFWEGEKQQEIVYNDALKKYKNSSRWLAIVDLDEFICPKEQVLISDFLKNYEDYPGLVINCVMFDSNGFENKPDGGVLENYTRVKLSNRNQTRTIASQYLKSIVNPLKVERLRVHCHAYFDSDSAIDSNYNKIIGPYHPNGPIDKIQINHYRTKSKEECMIKMRRGVANGVDKTFKEDEYNFIQACHDYTILKHINYDLLTINSKEINKDIEAIDKKYEILINLLNKKFDEQVKINKKLASELSKHNAYIEIFKVIIQNLKNIIMLFQINKLSKKLSKEKK